MAAPYLGTRPRNSNTLVPHSIPPQPDHDLEYVRRARGGDESAFGPLWDRYWDTLRRYFARHVNGWEEAEDLASETLLDCFRRIPEFQGLARCTGTSDEPRMGCTFKSYLMAIASKKAAMWLRSKYRRPACSLNELGQSGAEEAGTALRADEEADPLSAVLRQEHLDQACDAMVDVGLRSAEQFQVLLLHYFCEVPHKDIAKLTECRPATINTRLQEGRRTVTRHFQSSQLL